MTYERSRAWRRFKRRVNAGKGMGSDTLYKPEKNWKMMYFRKNKLARAKQLGFEYPRVALRQLLDKEFPSDERL